MGLLKKEREALLRIARDTIVSYVSSGATPATNSASPNLQALCGCFVTIKMDGNLRGCIGNFVSDKPLYLLVQEMAIAAATRDPRFYPMKQGDLADFRLEISVLSPLERAEPDDVTVGKHGIYISKNGYRGVLLPQVASEHGWDRDTFLAQTCRKAGLPADAWKSECDLFVFTAQVFGEN